MQPFFEDNADPFQIVQESGQEIPALMGEMMDRGYVLTGTEGKVSLMKLATDSDPKLLINPDFNAEDRSKITNIPTKMHALAVYLSIRDKPESHAPRTIQWSVQMLYHIGMDARIVNLDVVQAVTHQEAMELARVQAEDYIKARPDLHKFGYKEVKVRPAQITEE